MLLEQQGRSIALFADVVLETTLAAYAHSVRSRSPLYGSESNRPSFCDNDSRQNWVPAFAGMSGWG